MRILFSWEWGAGSGHLRRFVPLADFLVKQGHEVIIASKEIGSLAKLFPAGSYQWFQAPVVERGLNRFENPITIAQIANNLGLDSEARMVVVLGAWKSIFDAVRPDLVIADFGLAALALAASLDIPRIRLGTGYTCPPQQYDAPEMNVGIVDGKVSRDAVSLASRQWQQRFSSALRVLKLRDVAGWDRLLTMPARTLLATLPPLDPYAALRSDANYLGAWEHPGTLVPKWTGTTKFKCVAYLKPFRFLPALLAELSRQRIETWLYGDGIPEALLQNSHSDCLRLCNDPIHFDSLRSDCDFAICNANHGTTAKMLALGIPVLAVPLFLEQRITARAIVAGGWGVHVDPNHGASYGSAIARLLDPTVKDRAVAYSNQFNAYHHGALERAKESLTMMIDDICQ